MWLALEEQVQVIKDNSKYADYINHCREWKYYSNNLTYDPPTAAHECSHAIHAALRNSAVRMEKHLPVAEVLAKVNCFYVGDNKYVQLTEPRLRKSDAAKYIPSNLREYRFNTYVTGQKAWEDTPLYIFDEWTSYINGAEVAVEQYHKGNYREPTDQPLGPLEFQFYAIGLMMAVEKQDPEAFKEIYPFFKWQLDRGWNIVKMAQEVFPWSSVPRLLENFERSEQKKWLKDNFDYRSIVED